ncbi:MAG: hypothetical protein DRG30_00775 [Epsilonproteobacteria bacterium]|nr:MAG: hypothetical protein DRG30_00775 [Campylobacterota bacterium]
MIKILSTTLILATLSLTLYAEESQADKVKRQNIEVVKKAAEEIVGKLPQKVDNYTQLVNIVAKGENLIYTFEINTATKKDETVITEDRDRMQSAVVKGLCHSSKRFFDSGVQISYIYNSKISKKRLFQFDVARQLCIDTLGKAYLEK